ncbi:MAG: aspartate aminotransferase family protein [Spirochaetaceae bacterium]
MKPNIVSPPGIPRSYGREFLFLESGRGVYLKDGDGNRYLDFGAGIAVNALGYGRRDLARIAGRQMRKLIHVSNLYANAPAVELAGLLTDPTLFPTGGGSPESPAEAGAAAPQSRFAAVHFGNSGAEANESALKFARLYARRTRGEGHHKLASFTHGFHGRTMGALSVTPKEPARAPFVPLLPGTEVLPYNDPEALRVLTPEFAAVIVEVIQGEGGLTAMSPDFATALNDACRRHDILLIADEVQTGLRRTGSLFASMDVGLEPDIITMSKPLAGGLPLSATLIPARVNDLLEAGDHGTTFGGGPVTTAVATRVWRIIADPAFGRRIEETARHLDTGLKELAGELAFITELRGRGMLRGIVLEAGSAVKSIMDACRERGLLLLKSGDDVIRLAPPLVISKREIDMGIGILRRVVREHADGHVRFSEGRNA